MNILLIIPARGGSKGIPRKNLRRLVDRPLLSYAIDVAKASRFSPAIFVSSDDDEILSLAQKHAVGIIPRAARHATDQTTLDPVIHHALEVAAETSGKAFDLVITLQPTSPLLAPTSLDTAISTMVDNPEVSTIISAVEDTHLTWGRSGDAFVPNYRERVNRQFLPPTYRETGGFLITRTSHVTPTSRIGPVVRLHLLSFHESIDIDSFHDWQLCEYFLRRRRILLVVAGNSEIGLGHVYNALAIANDILDHDIQFLIPSGNELAYRTIEARNYKVHCQKSPELIHDVLKLAPHMVINDILDTDSDYVLRLKENSISVVNIEDLGPGAIHADLVVNAIYPETRVLPRHYFGHEYVMLRDEFLMTSPSRFQTTVSSVILTFGGVDPNNLTKLVLNAILPYCESAHIRVIVVLGRGYLHSSSLPTHSLVSIHRDVVSIADLIASSQVAFTSAGRTIYEVASLQVPAIVLAQNERELTHFFASANHGFINLGLGTLLSQELIAARFIELVQNAEQRRSMVERMAAVDLKGGRARTIRLLKDQLKVS